VSSITLFLYTNTLINFIFGLNWEFFTKRQTFCPDCSELDLIRADWGPNRGEHGFHEPGIVLHSFYF